MYHRIKNRFYLLISLTVMMVFLIIFYHGFIFKKLVHDYDINTVNRYVIANSAGAINNSEFIYFVYGASSTATIMDTNNNTEFSVEEYIVYYDGNNGVALRYLSGYPLQGGGTPSGTIPKYALTDSSGNLLTAFNYIDYIPPRNSKLPFIMQNENGYYGCLNRNGKEKLPFIYKEMPDRLKFDYRDDSALLIDSSNGSEVVMSLIFGNIIIPPKYKKVHGFYEGFCLVVNFKDKYAFFNNKGKNITKFIYDDAKSYSEGLAAVSVNGKWGFIDTNQQIIIPLEFKRVESFKYGYTEVETMAGEIKKIRSPIINPENQMPR